MSAPGGGPAPSPWVRRFAGLVPSGGAVLDLACGSGRHSRYFLGRGHPVVAVDRRSAGVADLRGRPGFEFVEADLEAGGRPAFVARRFAGVVATNYLHRPLLGAVAGAVAEDGVLLYETFAAGNARFGRPANPDFLLAPGELLSAVRGRLEIVAFEQGETTRPRPAAVQRICAVGPGYSAARRLDGGA